MSKYGAMVLVDGKRVLIKRERFTSPEVKHFVQNLSEQVLNKSLEMSQAGHQIYRKLNLVPPELQGCHWIFKSAAKFNKIEPWASHKLRSQKCTDPIKLTADGLKLRSEIVKKKQVSVKRDFIKLKTGQKISFSEISTPEMKEFIAPFCEKVNLGEMSEMEAGRAVYKKLGLEIPAAGTFWLFKSVAKNNGFEPWLSERKAPKELKEPRITSIHTHSTQLPTDLLTRIKNLEASIYSFEKVIEEKEALEKEIQDMKVSIELLMDTVSKIASAEGIHISAENEKEIVLRVPSALFFKQASVVEEMKIESFIKDKRIVLVGPESTQIRNLTERLPGAILNFFTGKDVSEQKMLLEKCESADLIVVWPRFTGHWATGCTRRFKEKRITTRSAGVKTTVDEILERLKWN